MGTLRSFLDFHVSSMSRELKGGVRLIRPGTVSVVLGGRYAGRKAIVIKSYDDGSKDRPYGHALVVGIDRYPRKITRKMSETKMAVRSRIKPFVKVINHSHLLPTRHAVNINFDTTKINKKAVQEKSSRRKARLEAKAKLEARYKTNENPWFFSKLRF